MTIIKINTSSSNKNNNLFGKGIIWLINNRRYQLSQSGNEHWKVHITTKAKGRLQPFLVYISPSLSTSTRNPGGWLITRNNQQERDPIWFLNFREQGGIVVVRVCRVTNWHQSWITVCSDEFVEKFFHCWIILIFSIFLYQSLEANQPKVSVRLSSINRSSCR